MTTGPDRAPLIDEQLSAWLDDELPNPELDVLATRLMGSPELQARLARYSLIGSSLRGGHPGRTQSELAALRLGSRVRAVLQEPADAPREAGSGQPMWRLRYALAAGVALAAVGIALAQFPLLRPAGDPLVAGSPPGARTQAVGELATPATVQAVARSPAPLSPKRLTNYLVYHGEYSGMLSARVTESHIVNYSPRAVAQRAVDRSPAQ